MCLKSKQCLLYGFYINLFTLILCIVIRDIFTTLFLYTIVYITSCFTFSKSSHIFYTYICVVCITIHIAILCLDIFIFLLICGLLPEKQCCLHPEKKKKSLFQVGKQFL